MKSRITKKKNSQFSKIKIKSDQILAENQEGNTQKKKN